MSTTATATDADAADGEYSAWSADFLELCRAQLDLLAGTVADVSEAAVFFRREAASGALEFVPLAVASVGVERVWIAHAGDDADAGAGAGGVELSRGGHVLPGGIAARELLPAYPAIDDVQTLPDGALCVPVEYNGVVAGSVVLWRQGAPLWGAQEVAAARAVARSIAIAAALDGKHTALEKARDRAVAMVEAVSSALGVATHQIRSPITALVTFGHVLLRRLPPGDKLRALAKSIVVEARRLDELMQPVEKVRAQLVLEEAHTDADVARASDDDDDLRDAELSDGGAVIDRQDETRKLLLLDRVTPQCDAQASGIQLHLPAFHIDHHQLDDVDFEDDDEVDDFDDENGMLQHDANEDSASREASSHQLDAFAAVLEQDDIWMLAPPPAIDASSSSLFSSSTPGVDVTQQPVVWLADIVEQLRETAQYLAAERGLQWHCAVEEDAPATRANPSDLREALYNLIHNALQYTPPGAGGHIGLLVRQTAVAVWDTGIGVRPEDAPHIWLRGVRAPPTADLPGHGFGLAVALTAVQASGGQAAVASPLPSELDPRVDPDSALPGAVFCLRFPRAHLQL